MPPFPEFCIGLVNRISLEEYPVKYHRVAPANGRLVGVSPITAPILAYCTTSNPCVLLKYKTENGEGIEQNPAIMC